MAFSNHDLFLLCFISIQLTQILLQFSLDTWILNINLIWRLNMTHSLSPPSTVILSLTKKTQMTGKRLWVTTLEMFANLWIWSVVCNTSWLSLSMLGCTSANEALGQNISESLFSLTFISLFIVHSVFQFKEKLLVIFWFEIFCLHISK